MRIIFIIIVNHYECKIDKRDIFATLLVSTANKEVSHLA